MNRRAFLAGGVGALAFFTGCISDSPSESQNSPPTDNSVEPSTSKTTTVSNGTSETNTPMDIFQMKSKYTKPQKIVSVNHQGIVNTREISYQDSVRKTENDDTPNLTENTAESADQVTVDDSIVGSVDTIRVWNNSTDARAIAITIEVTDRPADPLDQETYVGNSPENPILNETYIIDPDAYITIRLLKPGDYEVSVGIADRQTTTDISYATDNCNSQSLSVGVMPDGSVEHVAISTAMACISVNATTTAP